MVHHLKGRTDITIITWILFIGYIANCLINNLTIEIIVASKKMLLYSAYWYSLEEGHDESTEQTRIIAYNKTALSQGQ